MMENTFFGNKWKKLHCFATQWLLHIWNICFSFWLVVPKPSWPQPGKTGLAMKFLESDRNSYQYFTFEHSPIYQLVQKRFIHAVESLNLEHIIASGSNFFILSQILFF